MRFSLLMVGTLALAAAAFAAGRSENVTYVDGNLAGIAPHTSATLVYAAEKEMQLKAGLATVAIPFESIVKTELSAPQEHSNAAPLYKVWALPKHFSKTETNLLTVEFKDEEGNAKTMTLELASSPASNVVASIKQHNPNASTTMLAKADAPKKSEPQLKNARPAEESRPEAPAAKSNNEWWGDRYWKTSRNSGKWSEGSSANAPE